MKIQNKNQSGFGTIEVILVIVIIAIIGGVGWYVMHNRPKTTASSPPTAPTKPEIIKTSSYEGWKTYSKSNLEFKYPADWTLDEQTVLRLTSRDFKSTGVQYEKVTAGLLLLISQTDLPQKNVTADNYKESSSYQPSYTNFKILSINGNKAVRYNVEVNTLNTEFFRKDGTRIEASLTHAADDDKTVDTYNSILATIKVN